MKISILLLSSFFLSASVATHAQLFSPAQWARPEAVFNGGVCDWSQPGVGQQAAASPLDFADGPGGVPLPPAPVSQPFA